MMPKEKAAKGVAPKMVKSWSMEAFQPLTHAGQHKSEQRIAHRVP
ncbi:hypothetical protein AA14337_0845 [Acetobacter malorum DSM 14337]|uniref:Uncharacterized protein n=1 Tax=Acetobacter malorum DSM 14337 TaxID=1307910 RepID=A0ABQ0PPK4_9PROT|nr:hypothetical protein AA14337_0845 [Acetobacter malorum DSM 14337]